MQEKSAKFVAQGRDIFAAIQTLNKIMGGEAPQVHVVASRKHNKLCLMAKSMHSRFQQFIETKEPIKQDLMFSLDSKRLSLICKGRGPLKFIFDGKKLAFAEIETAYKGSDISTGESKVEIDYRPINEVEFPSELQQQLLSVLSLCQIKSVFKQEPLGCQLMRDGRFFYMSVSDRFHAVVVRCKLSKLARKQLANFNPILVPLEYLKLLHKFNVNGLRLHSDGKVIRLQNHELSIIMPMVQITNSNDVRQLVTKKLEPYATMEASERIRLSIENLSAVAKGRTPIQMIADNKSISLNYVSNEGRVAETLSIKKCHKAFDVKLEPHNAVDVLARLKGMVSFTPVQHALFINKHISDSKIKVIYVTALVQ